jgi:hypothetical protein
LAVQFLLVFVVSFFFFLKRFNGLGGGGGPAGCAEGPDGAVASVVDWIFLVVSFLCFLKRFNGLGGGGGPPGDGPGGPCANACVEMHSNVVNKGIINKYFSLAE